MIARRTFIAGLGAACAWPLAARGQQPALPVVGYLGFETFEASRDKIAAFRQGLTETGYLEGHNVAVEYRMADYHGELLPSLAVDLVSRNVAAIAALGGVRSALVAKAATTTIPIVFLTGGDPVELGLVSSLSRSGNNLTGVAALGNILVTKQLQWLRELSPKLEAVGFLVNPGNPITKSDTTQFQGAARTIGLRADVFTAGQPAEFDGAFAAARRNGIHAIIIQNEGLFNTQLEQLVGLAVANSMLAMHSYREFAAAGGLVSYGAEISREFQQVGLYIGRILKGEKPGDLPVLQPTKFDLVINLKTAKSLGLTVSPSLLALADEVIE
jgi:putative tryptophan/tyrosine transport system substrate-binding protein